MNKVLEIPSNNNIITRPAHYIDGREFEPIAVIEEFDLCHHLACVVKYIARAGRKTNTLNDLRKAEWYLDRELIRCNTPVNPCLRIFEGTPAFSIQDILEDWELVSYLDTVLSYILTSKLGIKGSYAHKNFGNYACSLKRAKEFLQLAIFGYEQGVSQ